MMKKMLLPIVAIAFALTACESEKSKDVVPQASTEPVKEAPVAKPVVEKTMGEVVKAEIRTIDWTKAEELAAAGALYVDVRNPDERNSGYVMGSVNIPLPELSHRMSELPKDKNLLVYCRSGRRSEAATNLLQKNGYESVYNVAGGFLAYPKK